MLKIKDNTIQKRLKGNWYYKEYKYISQLDIDLKNDKNKYDVLTIIDGILGKEGYEINFDNCAYLSQGDVVTYEFDDNYSIDLYQFNKEGTEFTLSFLLKEFDNFNDIWELQYLKNIYDKIVNQIKTELVEKSD